MLIYGQKTPPFYDLSKITLPVHLYVGKYDKMADMDDATKLFSQLKNSVGKVICNLMLDDENLLIWACNIYLG